MDEMKDPGIDRKRKHPMNKGNILFQMFYCWFPSFLVKGVRKEIIEDDMYEVEASQKSAELGDRLEAKWNNELIKSSPSLTKALFAVFGGELALYALIHITNEFVKMCQPILMFKLLTFFQNDDLQKNKWEVFGYGVVIVSTSLIRTICLHNYQLLVMTLGMKVRVAVCSLIYRKSLKLSKTALAETTIGQMVNLLSNDVGRFDFAAQNIHYLWIGPVETVIMMYLLYIYVGISGIVGIFFIVAFLPLQIFMAKLVSKYRLKTAIRTDERVRLMNEIISGIQVIKMYTWEKPFSKLVELVRKKEIDQIKATSTIKALTKSCTNVLSRIAVYLCILTHISTGNPLTATYIYTLVSFYGVLKLSVTGFVPQAMTQFAETRVSVKRIKKFLLYDELPEKSITTNASVNGLSTKHGNESRYGGIRISMNNVTVRWSDSFPEDTLHSVDFDATSNQLVAVVGPVGGGKTSLLNVILKELPPRSGTLENEGTISYASQEPWIFVGSIRQNILFGQAYEPKKYGEVIRVCALESDLVKFPHGDRTLVGERGVTLSGGQRARINLARAVYKEADIYLLDDPLSAVDTHVGKQLFEECICGYLKNKCVVLVTHQIQYLRSAHCIYLLEDGRVHFKGTYEELKTSETHFMKLLAESKKEVEENEEVLAVESIHREGNISDETSPMIPQKEKVASGNITWHVYKSYLRAGGSWFKIVMLLLAFIMSQGLGSMIDCFLTIWVNSEQSRHQQSNITSLSTASVMKNVSENIVTSPYRSENWWNSNLTTEISLIIYSCLLMLSVIINLVSEIAFFRCCMKASVRLHNSMFSKIIHSSMGFFNTNPSGRILNRFSKDIGVVDEILPLTIIDTIEFGMLVVAVSFIIGILNPWILLPTTVILIICNFLRKAFLVSSRNIKRIEGITRSPVYTHLAASLQGLSTIRAFEVQEILSKEFDNLQDSYTSAYFMFLSANRGFGFWLDIHCVTYIFLVTISVFFIQNESFGGNVGLSLSQAMSLAGIFQWVLRQWSETENNMTSIERIQEYIDIEPERDSNSFIPPESWPNSGGIELVNLSLRYSADGPFILKNLVLEIKPKEKIGIVGRTGAGKSSLIQALFRLTDIDGSILIDDVDTKNVPLKILRSKISIIPQEPVLFSGSLRKNLDPFDDYNDEILWNALDQVELKTIVSELPEGLNSEMAEGGSNFSVGQRQLVCLARAIVRNNKILVLDEATANIDPQTDSLIQSTIRQKFDNCTVLTIAHRLHTIMDSDRVLVMDAGEVKEFGHPHLLLQNDNGVFQGLVKETGSAMAANLREIAKQTSQNISGT
nr:multidrug resistance-associated protein 4-like [Leptinotarsa decemlineata]